MICKKCGYDYPAKELKCPYCGEVNPLGEKWKNEENLARKETLLTKARVIHSMPLYVADKVMNVILLVVMAVTAITILVLAIVFGLEKIHITCQQNRASVQEAEELLVAEDYTGLYDYLHSHEVYGQEEFEKYTERVRLYDDYQAIYERPVSASSRCWTGRPGSRSVERCEICTLDGKEYPGNGDRCFLPRAGI